MKGVFIAIGVIATTILIVYLVVRKPDENGEHKLPADEESKNKDNKKRLPEEPDTKEDKKRKGGGRTGGGGKWGSIVGGALGELKDIVVTLPEPTPEPTPSGPDPTTPTLTPTQGQYYQVTLGDTIWDLCKIAYYGAGYKWETMIKPTGQVGGMNNWIRKTGNATWSGKGLYPQYSGYDTQWGSGHQFPVVYFPVED